MNVGLATESPLGTAGLNRPALDDVGVIGLVPERWGGMWLSRHQILTRLSKYFHVVWHNPPQEWRSAPKPITHADPTPPPSSGFSVYAPEAWLPRFYRPRALDRATEQARLHRSRRILEKASEPKRLWVIQASDHRFSDNLGEFDRRLLEAIGWVRQNAPQ